MNQDNLDIKTFWEQFKEDLKEMEPSPLWNAYRNLMKSSGHKFSARDLLESSKGTEGSFLIEYATNIHREIRESREIPDISKRTISPSDGNWTKLEDAALSLISKGATQLHLESSQLHNENANLTDKVAELQKEAKTDALTGLPNRRAFETYSEMETGYATIDFDHFSNINNTCGHGVGDIALKTIADLIHSSLRVGEVAYRVGGDEFSVKFHYDMEDEQMMQAGERIRKTVETMGAQTVYFKLLGLGMDDEAKNFKDYHDDFAKPMSVSVGLSYRTSSPNRSISDAKFSVKNADIAAYHAKQERNKVVLFQEGMTMPN